MDKTFWTYSMLTVKHLTDPADYYVGSLVHGHTVDGNSEIGAHVRINLLLFNRFKPSIRSKAIPNLIFFLRKDLVFFVRIML